MNIVLVNCSPSLGVDGKYHLVYKIRPHEIYPECYYIGNGYTGREWQGTKCTKEILGFYSTSEEAYEAEFNLLTPETLKDPRCLNRCGGGGVSSEWNNRRYELGVHNLQLQDPWCNGARTEESLRTYYNYNQVLEFIHKDMGKRLIYSCLPGCSVDAVCRILEMDSESLRRLEIWKINQDFDEFFVSPQKVLLAELKVRLPRMFGRLTSEAGIVGILRYEEILELQTQGLGHYTIESRLGVPRRVCRKIMDCRDLSDIIEFSEDPEVRAIMEKLTYK